MRHTFKLPDVGEGTAEAEIIAWHVGIGDAVREDQHLVDVMTDKATVEITSPVAGTVLALHGNPGDMATVGAPLVEFETEAAAVESAPVRPAPVERVAPMEAAKVLAAPAVRQRAANLGIDLGAVSGTGPDGRITHDDLDALLAAEPSAPREQPAQATTEVKISGLRRRIAERMAEAKRHIPHFAYVEEIDVTELEALRAHLNTRTDRPRLTPLPFLIRALVRTVPEFPQMNAHFDDEAGVVTRFAAIHAGIATATEAGLMVPVVKHAERRNLWDTAGEIARVAERARNATATKDELTESTITITSLGPLGGLATTPIINRPEVAILAPNAIVERAVVRAGAVTIRKTMNLSSSFDHRVVDGADAARFVQRLKARLEHPALLWLVD